MDSEVRVRFNLKLYRQLLQQIVIDQVLLYSYQLFHSLQTFSPFAQKTKHLTLLFQNPAFSYSQISLRVQLAVLAQLEEVSSLRVETGLLEERRLKGMQVSGIKIYFGFYILFLQLIGIKINKGLRGRPCAEQEFLISDDGQQKKEKGLGFLSPGSHPLVGQDEHHVEVEALGTALFLYERFYIDGLDDTHCIKETDGLFEQALELSKAEGVFNACVKNQYLHYNLMADTKTEAIKVVVRCRPISKNQLADGHIVVVNVDEARKDITVLNPANKDQVKAFTFDKTYGMESQQEVIFNDTALPILESCFEGYNGTIFAYGQTATGKTFTMDGDELMLQKGIMPRTIDFIFQRIKESSQKKKYLVHASYVELYNQQLIDLWDKQTAPNLQAKKKKVEIHEKAGVGIYLSGVSKFMMQDKNQMFEKLEQGKKNRKQACTLMNERSSRSHTIFMITIETSESVDGHEVFRVGKLNMVDLAGSQRQSKTQVTGEALQQASQINLSLTYLGLVIESLVSGKKSHIPYRDSILTRMLQDSLGGNTKTVMIANIGPASYNYAETVNTLKYANRAKNIQNKPAINEDPKDALLRQFQLEIMSLKEELSKNMGEHPLMDQHNNELMAGPGNFGVEQIEQLQREREKAMKKLQQQKKGILQLKNINQQQKNKMIKGIQQKEKEQEELKQKQEKIIKKLKKMEQMVLHGTELEENAKIKKKEWKEAQEQLQRQKRQEDLQRKKLKEFQEQIDSYQKKYQNQRQEIQDKTRRIKNFTQKLKQIEQDNKEQDEQYADIIEELQERRRILHKELSLKELVMQYFIPQRYIQTLKEQACFNWQTDNWQIPSIQFAGNNVKKPDPYALYPGQVDINELVKAQLQNHPNMFYIYTDEGLVREEEATDDQKKAKKQRRKKKKK